MKRVHSIIMILAMLFLPLQIKAESTAIRVEYGRTMWGVTAYLIRVPDEVVDNIIERGS